MNEDDLLDFAKETVGSVVGDLKKNIHNSLKIQYKAKFDLYTEMDKWVENEIVRAIRENFPEHDIVTEEADTVIGKSDHVWYIDPISGSTNYAHGIPIYGISLALEVRENIEIGAIYNSVEDEIFYAERGKGAYVEGEKLSVSDVEEIQKSTVSTSFPYNKSGRNKNLAYFKRIAPEVEGVRRTGSVSVDLSYLAHGSLDAFWAVGLKSWDTAACWLLVEESGGRVSRINGQKYELERESILVSNGKTHEDMVRLLNG